jgi:subtilase-type serine protease
VSHPGPSRRLRALFASLSCSAILVGCGGGEDGETATSSSTSPNSYLPGFLAPPPLLIDVLTNGFLLGQDVADLANNLLATPQYDNSRASIPWIRLTIDSSVPTTATNHPLQTSGAAVAHAAGYTGKGKLIAFSDLYFADSHEVFAGKTVDVLTNGARLVDDGTGQLVPYTHGISVASVAAGRSADHIGIAPDANMMFGTWDEGSMAQLGQRAFTDGAVAWNNSWEYRGVRLDQTAFDTIFGDSAGQEYLSALDLYGSTGVVVFAVSNDRLRNATLMDGLPVLRNALEAGWLAVANGVPTMNGDTVSEVHLLSNSCWEAARWCLVADGSWRAASDEADGYRFMTGSSFAAPQVSAALAILSEAFTGAGLTPHELRVRLLASADDGFFTPDATVELAEGFFKGYSITYGHGFLDIEAALRPIGQLSMATATGAKVPAGAPVLKTGAAFGDAVEQSLSGTDVAVKDALSASFAMPAKSLTTGALPPARAGTLLAKTFGADLRAERLAAPMALSDPFAAQSGRVMGLSGPYGTRATILLPQEGSQTMGVALSQALTDGPTRVDLGLKLARDDGGLMSMNGDSADMASVTLGLTQDLAGGAFLALSGEFGMTDLGGETALGNPDRARFDAVKVTVGQNGVLGKEDRLSLGLGMPVAIASGRTDLTLPVYSKQGTSFRKVPVDLAPEDRQVDLEVGYQAALSELLEMKLSLVHSDSFGNRAGVTDSGGLVAFTFRY